MGTRILSLDIGGSAAKAALYVDDSVQKRTSWRHNYADCGLSLARDDLVKRIHRFCGGAVDAVGLGLAGLIDTNGSLYRSTVLTSFEGFNIPDLLTQELGVAAVSVDNDADCGGVSAWSRHTKSLLYVVLGSGVGSAYVDSEGNLPYRVRVDPSREFSADQNPVPNDLGLQLGIPREFLYRTLANHEISQETVDTVMVDTKGRPLAGPRGDRDSVRLSAIASGPGLRRILEMEILEHNRWLGEDAETLEQYYQKRPFFECFKQYTEQFEHGTHDYFSEKRIARLLYFFASAGEFYSREAFGIFAEFLGCGIAAAQQIVRADQGLSSCPGVILGGGVANGFGMYGRRLQRVIAGSGGNSSIELAGRGLTIHGQDSMEHSNLHGAYLQARKELLELTELRKEQA